MPRALVMPRAMAMCTPSATRNSRLKSSASAALTSNTRLLALPGDVEPRHHQVVHDRQRAADENDEARRPGRDMQRALALELVAHPGGDRQVPSAPDDEREERHAEQIAEGEHDAPDERR